MIGDRDDHEGIFGRSEPYGICDLCSGAAWMGDEYIKTLPRVELYQVNGEWLCLECSNALEREFELAEQENQSDANE